MKASTKALPGTPELFWAPFERTVSSFAQFRTAMRAIYDEATEAEKVFAWRGAVDARWGLHSSLYRDVLGRSGRPPNEVELAEHEARVINEFERWGLHNRERGRMGALDQLATMQHYGAPTRLLDITFNAYIALWFAVEPKAITKERPTDFDKVDGRVFAVDVSKRMINEDPDLRSWDSQHARPWASLDPTAQDDWSVRALAWTPAPFERRIAAQQGGFLLGGVPIYQAKTTNKKYQWPKDTSSAAKWAHGKVLESTCVAIRPHKLGADRGRRPTQPCYTIRVRAGAKSKIRRELRSLFGYEHRTLFPDFPGFAAFGPLSWASK